ncbi:immunoglobulin E-set [Annulohypoxylon bovei var. microspora]|nr:immunoglobulin E-set [Annulohypoxylon bovei var. microspora]
MDAPTHRQHRFAINGTGRGRILRHMVSMPLMMRSRPNDTPVLPTMQRLSEVNLNATVQETQEPSLHREATLVNSSEYDSVRTRKSFKEFFKNQFHLSTKKLVSRKTANQTNKKPHLRMEFLSWLKERASSAMSRPSSSSSSDSGLDPYMTCIGNPAHMVYPEEETTVVNPSASPSPYTSLYSTSPTPNESSITYSKVRKDASNKNSIDVDANDESLQRYKQSLGLGGGKDLSDPNDPRVCIINALTMESPGRSPVTIDLSAAGSEQTLKDRPFKIKEGCKFTMVASFKVQHEILSGLQYVQVVKRKGIKVSKDSEMLGSYAPSTEKQPLYSKRFQEEEAPSGMLARGHYNATSSFVDDDKKTHLQFEWSFDIAKDW